MKPFAAKRPFGRKHGVARIGEFAVSVQSQITIRPKRFRFSRRYYALRTEILGRLFAEIGADETHGATRAYLEPILARYCLSGAKDHQTTLTRIEAQILVSDLIDDLIGFGPLEDLLQRDAITDIMVIGPKLIFYEELGRIHEAEIEFQDEAHLVTLCQRIARRIGRRIDESSPMCDARLPDGSRVNMIVPPLAIDGASLTIRKFQTHRLTLSDLIQIGTLDPRTVEFLHVLVKCRCNILVVGGTGSGKTTLLNSLNQTLPDDERIVTCEDAAELQLQKRHVVRLETRAQNLEGSGEVTIRALVRNSLRMRPDRIILGEVRGEEAFDFIQAMNTGHDGSMGTMHANSSLDALSRLEGLISLGAPSLPVATIRQMITSALDIIIEIRRFNNGSRRISNILEILGLHDTAIQTNRILDLRERRPSKAANTSTLYHFYPVQSYRIKQKAEHAECIEELLAFSNSDPAQSIL